MRERTMRVFRMSVRFSTWSFKRGCQSDESRNACFNSSRTSVVSRASLDLVFFITPSLPTEPSTDEANLSFLGLMGPLMESRPGGVRSETGETGCTGAASRSDSNMRGEEDLLHVSSVAHSRHCPFGASSGRTSPMLVSTLSPLCPLFTLRAPVLESCKGACGPSSSLCDGIVESPFLGDGILAPGRVGTIPNSENPVILRPLLATFGAGVAMLGVPPLFTDDFVTPTRRPAASSLPTSSSIINSRSPSILPMRRQVTSTPIESFSSWQMPYSERQTHSLRGWIKPTIFSASLQGSLPR
mmetsp:Transcript_137803/g.294484  ORF Transcript_137803/g.294484 Transcript_137803/m.294484 type:complete len:299 (+) Transcript_137803:766-1662(+)